MSICMHVILSGRCFSCFIVCFLQKFDGEIKATVDAAVKIAKSECEVGPEELTGDIYCNNLEPYIRGTIPWDKHKHIRIGAAVNIA